MPYLDWNATAPIHHDVVRRMTEASTAGWANPQSVHAHGREARKLVEEARHAVASLAGVDPRDVIFTSGGTEANNLALRSAASRPGPIVTSRLEHPSVLRVAEAYPERAVFLRVTPEGTIDLDDLAKHAKGAAVVAIQAVNHETGAIEPLAEIARLLDGALFHVDSVQAWGRVAVEPLAGDTRALAAHKLRGPKGIGALILRGACLALTPVLLGGGQERGLRPGTVDPIACAGLAAAIARVPESLAVYTRLALLRDRLEEELVALGGIRNVPPNAPRAPHVISIAFPSWSGAELVAALDLEGVSISSGSACSAGTLEPSPVIAAMHGEERARSSVRISLGEETSADDIDVTLATFRRVLARSLQTNARDANERAKSSP